MQILVAETNKKVAKFIYTNLKDAGYAVEVVSSLKEVPLKAESDAVAAVILDAQMEGGGGLDLLRKIRKKGFRKPVMLLSNQGTVDDIVAGLDAGADAYMTKPYDFREFLARIQALLRRATHERGAVISFADLYLDPVQRIVWRAGREIELTGKEYELLEFLINNPNTVLSRQAIADAVWDFPFDKFTNIIDVYINYLRKKVDKGFPTRLIHTVRKIGYILKDE